MSGYRRVVVWSVALGLVGSAAAGVAIYWFFPPYHRASAVIEFRQSAPRILPRSDDAPPMSDGAFTHYVEAQAARARSKRVINQVMVDDKWIKVRPPAAGLEDAHTRFVEALRAEAAGPTVHVTFDDRDPAVAATAVQMVCECFRRLYREEEFTSAQRRNDVLSAERHRLTDELQSTRMRIGAICGRYGTDDLRMVHQSVLAEVNKLESALWELQATVELQALLLPPTTAPAPATLPANAVGVTVMPLTLAPEEIALFDDAMWKMINEREFVLSRLRYERTRYGDEHPTILAIRFQLERADRGIDEYRRRYLSAHASTQPGPDGDRLQAPDVPRLTDMQIAVMHRRIGRVRDDLAHKTSELNAVSADLLTLSRLRQEEQPVSRSLEALTGRLKADEMQANAFPDGSVSVFDGPTEDIPAPLRNPFIAAGGVGGFLVPFLPMFLIGRRRVRKVTRADMAPRDSVMNGHPEGACPW